MQLTQRQEKLLQYVKLKHGEQKRKYTGEPYWNHCFRVAKMLWELDLRQCIEIALCHDLFEDTDCNSKQLELKLGLFGYGDEEIEIIVLSVQALTNVYTTELHPDKNRNKRKRLEAYRLGGSGYLPQTVKYIDIVDNLQSMVDYDPKFTGKYVQEKVFLLDCIRNGDIRAFVKCCFTIQETLDKLGMKIKFYKSD